MRKSYLLLLFSGIFLLSCTTPTTQTAADKLSPIGMLKTRDYIVTMYVGVNETLYTVKAHDGTVLQRDVNVDSMLALFPALGFHSSQSFIDFAGTDEVFTRPPGSENGLMDRNQSRSKIKPLTNP